MPLSVSDVFGCLSEWPHRGVGTEEELEAREMLMTELSAEFEVDIKEEGFQAPTSYIPFLWLTGLMAIFAVIGTPLMPTVMALVGGLAFVSLFLFFDWRISPLVWIGSNLTTANLVASKGEGQRLFVLMAHLDSAPASYAYRPAQIPHFKISVYLSAALMGLGFLIPFMATFGAQFDMVTLLGIAALMLIQLTLASIDYWRHGYTPGANDNLSGVAAATSAASHLWRRMPPGAEVRLVITSGEEAGMLGAQHYWQVHKEELRSRDTYIINMDTVGCRHLKFVTKSGGFTPVVYDNVLTQTALNLTLGNEPFQSVAPAVHSVGDFDSVWFVRDGMNALTIASYDDDGHMTAIHTPDDTHEKVNFETMALAARFAEAIVRTCPVR